LVKAGQFSTESGIILKLSKDIRAKDPPKYLDVHWLSNYPAEEERLFYGSDVHFAIEDIREVGGDKSYFDELAMFNKLQRTLTNERERWVVDEGDITRGTEVGTGNVLNGWWQMEEERDALIKQQRALSDFIEFQIDRNERDESALDYDYGQQLFSEFCKSTEWITVRDYTSIPSVLRHALFGQIEEPDPESILSIDDNDRFLSLSRCTRIFPNVQKMMFKELPIDRITSYYVETVRDYLKESRSHPLHTISFVSRLQSERKRKEALHDLKVKYSREFREEFDWKIEYECRRELHHKLVFQKLNPRTEEMGNNEQRHFAGKAATYSMHINSVHEEVFGVTVVASNQTKHDRLLFIKERRSVTDRIVRSFKIKGGRKETSVFVELKKEQFLYRLGLYRSDGATRTISGSSEIQFKIPKERAVPMQPQCIQSASVLKLCDATNQTVNVHWAMPLDVVGALRYRVQYEGDVEEKEENVHTPPLVVKAQDIPTSFRVVTVTAFNGVDRVVHESVPSEVITVETADLTEGRDQETKGSDPRIDFVDTAKSSHAASRNRAKFVDLGGIPSFFINILSIDSCVLTVEVVRTEPAEKDQCIFLKDTDNAMSSFGFKRAVMIQRDGGDAKDSDDSDHRVEITVPLQRKEGGVYSLGLYQCSNPDSEMVPNSMGIQFSILEGIDAKYVQNPVAASSVKWTLNRESDRVYVIWPLPPKSFGDLSYSVVIRGHGKEEEIPSLPWIVPVDGMLKPSGFSFQVIAKSVIDGEEYVSDPSGSININPGISDSINIRDQINRWENLKGGHGKRKKRKKKRKKTGFCNSGI